jgi:hypothetical protein
MAEEGPAAVHKRPVVQHQGTLCSQKGLQCTKTCCKTESYGNGFVHQDTQETKPMLASRWRYALDARMACHVRSHHGLPGAVATHAPGDGTHRGTVSARLGCGRLKPGQLGYDDGAERRQVVLNRVPHQALVDHVIRMPVEIAYRRDARPIDGRMPGFEGLRETTGSVPQLP